jgi:hypothetical protein
MNREDISRLILDAGNGDEEWAIIAKQLHKHFPEETQRFAQLVAQHEREACAKLAENSKAPFTATAIRARGQA